MIPGDHLYPVCFEPCWGLRDVEVTASLLDIELTVFSLNHKNKILVTLMQTDNITCT